MVKNPNRVVLDTNVLVSAIVYGGRPQVILGLVLKEELQVVISETLITELREVIHKRFPFHITELEYLLNQIKIDFEIVLPMEMLTVARDKDDDRVLEAAVAGNCEYIVTGDRDLLTLGKFRSIKIVTPSDFLVAISGEGE